MPLSLKTNRSLCKKLLMAVILLAGLAQYTFADENREIGIAFIPDEKVKVTAGEKAQAELTLEFPGKSTLKLKLSSEDSFTIGETEFSISIPSGAPTNIVFMAHVVNRDLHWFQRVNRVHLQPGITNKTTVSFEPGAREWRPLGHHGGWNGRTMLNPREVAINLYSDVAYTGVCDVAIQRAERYNDTRPPVISAVRPSGRNLGTYSRYEVSLSLPDRYRDPYDINQVHLSATFTHSNTPPVTVDGFYFQNYFRTVATTGEVITPHGAPGWRIRYCPTKPGTYNCTIKVKDSFGEASHPTLTFNVTNSFARGIARISEKDPRYFETSNGDFFFPVGHNIRSPFDARMDKQFPWRDRRKEGSFAYNRYFSDMQAHGEDLAEVWSCAWSLGLEWTPRDHGYHGVGDYNLIHAWELDHVLNMAEKRGIYINLVLKNHGRLSTFCDPEWVDNPYNTANGGYLKDPMDFFDNQRAINDSEKLFRYMIARYGAYANIFAWELWSELNLIGHGQRTPNPHHQGRVVTWHQHFGKFFKKNDPWKHLVATHVSSDYKMQNPALVKLKEMDHAPVDAYHASSNPLYIVGLINSTTTYNATFNKPVIITEFGGSPHAGGKQFLERELHCALWSSTCSGIAATPLFWWWQLIEEAEFYPMYAAIAKFMKDVDLRDPRLKKTQLTISHESGVRYAMKSIAMISPEQAIGWIYVNDTLIWMNRKKVEECGRQNTTIRNLNDGIYRITFIDTATGESVHTYEERSRDGSMPLKIIPFTRDIAFKISAITK